MKKKLLLRSLSLFFVFAFLYANASSDAEVNTQGWKAGVASVMITPEKSMWMAGYAGRNRPAEGTLHDLWAKALVVEDANGERAVLITTDLIGFRKYLSNRIRDRLNVKFGLSKAQIILSSSHTHTGPALQSAPDKYLVIQDSVGEYSAFHRQKIKQYTIKLEDQIVNLVGEAMNSMVPVQMFSGNGVARFAVNRRNNPATTLRPHTQTVGPVDHAVPVIKVTKTSGELLALVFGYACHSTTLSIYQWTGDYPGFAQIALEKAFPGTTAMFFAGAGADQNPLPRRTIGHAQQYGATLAAAVKAVISEPMQELSPRLSTAYSEVDLHYGDPPPPKKDELLEIMEESSDHPPYLKRRANLLLNQLEHGKTFGTSYPYPVQIWRIGEQNLVVLGGEVVVDYSIRLKQIFGQDLFVMAYANEMMGYIPSTRVYSEEGYEGSRSAINEIVFTRPWAPDVEMVIVSEIIRLAQQSGITFN